MRERQNADVYVLVTSQNASAGSREMQLLFLYDGHDHIPSDTIIYYQEPNISDDDERRQFMKYFKQGILPVLIETSLKDQITYEIPKPEGGLEVNNTAVKDPWNYTRENTMRMSCKESDKETI